MIEERFKHKFILSLIGIVLTGMGVIALLLYSTIPRSETGRYADAIRSFLKADDALSGAVRIAFIVESLVISVQVVLAAVLASHKIAGPVYSLRRVLSELANTRKVRPVAFRNSDQLHDTAGRFNAMINGLNERFCAISEAYEEFEAARTEMDGASGSVERLKEKADNLGKAIERFSV